MRLDDFWEEIRPIIKHGLAAAVLVLVSAGLLRLIVTVMPATHASELSEIEHRIAVIALILFGTNATASLVVTMFRGLRQQITKKSGADADKSQTRSQQGQREDK